MLYKTLFFPQSSKIRVSLKKHPTLTNDDNKEANLRLFWNYVNDSYFKPIQKTELDALDQFSEERPLKEDPSMFFGNGKKKISFQIFC